jgi:hypothetical protein
VWLFDEDNDKMEECPQGDGIEAQCDILKPESFTKNKQGHSEVHWISCSLVKPVMHQHSGFFAEYGAERFGEPDGRCPFSLCQEEEDAYSIEEKTDSDQQQAEGPNNADIELNRPPLCNDIREITHGSPRHKNRKQNSPQEKHLRKLSDS